MRIKIVQMVQCRDGVLVLSDDGDMWWGRFDEYEGCFIWHLVTGPTR